MIMLVKTSLYYQSYAAYTIKYSLKIHSNTWVYYFLCIYYSIAVLECTLSIH